MQKIKQPYDFKAAAVLENYVRKRYRNQLSNSDLSFYLNAFPALERSGLGLCKPITADYRTLAEVGLKDLSGIKTVLSALSGVLAEVEIGAPIKGGKKATRLRRFDLSELKNGDPKRKLIDTTPADARELAEILSGRTFVYGEETPRPFWNVLKTGRVQSAKPNLQGDPPAERVKKLCAGLQPGQVLISADFKAADPTILQDVIEYRFNFDPYEQAAALLKIDRSEAKRKINALAYYHDSKASLSFWECPQAEAVFMPYVEALTAYKAKLWESGQPRNKRRRYVHTLPGRKIEADRGKPPHRGQVLSWQIQGTVADVINAATLKAIEREPSAAWKVLFPVHDSLYIAGKPEQAAEVAVILEAEAQRLNLPLTVKVETFTAGGVV